MARLSFGLACFVIGLALSQMGCENSEQKAAQPEPMKSSGRLSRERAGA